MKRVLEYLLPIHDEAIGHWRFRGDLTDLSGNARTLTGTGIATADYMAGKTENGLTALDLDGAAQKASIPAASAGAFDMGVLDFTIEAILKTSDDSGTIISKWFSGEGASEGWDVSIIGGKVKAYVSDGTATACTGALTVSDGRWHYIAVTINRTTDQLRIFVDGVEDTGNPFDISARTGNFTSAASNLTIGQILACLIDEVTVIGEVLTPMAIANRAAGAFREADPTDDYFLVPFVPRVNQGNAALKKFLIPFSRLYAETILQADGICDLARWDECPQAFLTHLASTLGFELIDLPYATEAERRACLAAAVSLYQKKGTLAGIEQLIGLLGCGCDLTEIYSLDVPFIANQHRSWSLAGAGTASFEDDFTALNLSKWLQPLNLTSWWRTYYDSTPDISYLIATGNAADDNLNGMLFLDDETDYRIEVDYEIIAGATAPAETGIFLRYFDSSNWIKLEFQVRAISGSPQYLVLVKNVAGAEASVDLVEIDTTVVAPATGRHVLWVFVSPKDANDDYLTVGFDDVTLVYRAAFSTAGISNTKKGLWVNRSMTVNYYGVELLAIDRHAIAKAFDPDFAYRELQIHLTPTGTPTGKVEYLERVIPKYVPAGVEVTWT